jgi:hypothetical protein
MSGSISIQRQISGAGLATYPDCVVEEVGTDTLQITEHPVETGATITDHAFKKPREVTLRWSWSDSSPFFHAAQQGIVLQIYNSLLTLQASLTPFTLYTGKSAYSSMLLESVKQTTTKDSEFSLQITAICKEIIIVYTTTTSVGGTSPTASASSMKNPSATAPTTQTGQSTRVPVSNPNISQNQSVFPAGGLT